MGDCKNWYGFSYPLHELYALSNASTLQIRKARKKNSITQLIQRHVKIKIKTLLFLKKKKQKNFNIGVGYTNPKIKVLIKLFQKFAGVWGRSPHGLDFDFDFVMFVRV